MTLAGYTHNAFKIHSWILNHVFHFLVLSMQDSFHDSCIYLEIASFKYLERLYSKEYNILYVTGCSCAPLMSTPEPARESGGQRVHKQAGILYISPHVAAALLVLRLTF